MQDWLKLEGFILEIRRLSSTAHTCLKAAMQNSEGREHIEQLENIEYLSVKIQSISESIVELVLVSKQKLNKKEKILEEGQGDTR